MTALTNFTDGVVVHQGHLNNLSVNIDTLTQLATGKTAASGVSHKPMALVRLTSNLPVVTGNDLLIAWHSEVYDSDNLWTPSVPNRFSIQTPGKYVITTGSSWFANSAGDRHTKIYVNGTSNANTVASFGGKANSSFETCYTVTSPPISLASGAAVYGDVYQNSGGPLNLGLGLGGTWMAIEWVAPQ
jgi:hypothetical protein